MIDGGGGGVKKEEREGSNSSHASQLLEMSNETTTHYLCPKVRKSSPEPNGLFCDTDYLKTSSGSFISSSACHFLELRHHQGHRCPFTKQAP